MRNSCPFDLLAILPVVRYNAQDHPLCLHGYEMSPNSHNYARRRTRWCCAHLCLQQTARPTPACPYLTPEHRHGQVVNVGRTLPNGSVRLTREVAYDSRAWKERYGRRNLSESRNGSQERMGLKRLPCFGLSRGRKEVAPGDFLDNLYTLARYPYPHLFPSASHNHCATPIPHPVG